MHIKSLQAFEPYSVTDSIENLSLSSPYERLFFETQKSYKAFEDSWFSLIQGIRYNPRIYRRKIYFADHPYKPHSIVVYNHLCKSHSEFSRLLSDLIDEADKKEAVWKNADPEDLVALLRVGFKCYQEKDGWSPVARYDDQTFGQYVCPLKSIALLEGSKFAQIRQQARAVEKTYNSTFSFEVYKNDYKDECARLVFALSKEIGNNNNMSPTDIMNANLIYLSFPPNNSFILRHKEKIVSFIAFDVRGKIANFNCLIYQRNPKYISTYTMVKAAQELYQRGASMVNLSGSELKSLDNWKNKFNPTSKIERIHLVLPNKRINYESTLSQFPHLE